VKAAIYRTASDSKVIQSLIDAADNGKQVAVMVELKARFDEKTISSGFTNSKKRVSTSRTERSG
jgi:Polyphosphate kinase